MKGLVLALMTWAAVVVNFNTAFTQPLSPTPRADFFDDFNDFVADNWQPFNSSRWQISVENGSPANCLAIANPNGDEYTVMNALAWSTFAMEVDAKSLAGTSQNFFIAFGMPTASGPVNYYYLRFTVGGIDLFRVSDIIASAAGDFVSDNQYHRVRIERQSPSIKVFVDGQLLLQAVDATFTAGYIGFGSFKSTACFDNVAMTSSISAAAGPVVYFGHGVNDDEIPLSYGDNDGRPEHCEKVELSVIVRNAGTNTATNVSGTLTTSDPDVTIIDDSNCWPDVPGGTTAENACQFAFSVTSNLTQDKSVSFMLTITASNGGPWTSTFSVNVYAHDQLFFCNVTEQTVTAVSKSAVAWADVIGNDGYLDAVIIGQDENSREATKFYLNNGGRFTDASATANLIGVKDGAVAWGDYDNDEAPDLLIAGDATGAGLPRVTRIYHYDGGGRFTNINANLPGVRNGAVAWVDYDNDGDLDVLLTGSSAPGVNIAKIYRNDNKVFSEAVSLPGVAGGSAAVWGDYDNDGDADILLAGLDNLGVSTAAVYQNNNGSFTNIGANLIGVSASAAAWGDYDSDGDLDILLAGRTSSGSRVTKIYRNNLGNFTDVGASLPGVDSGAVAWGDYDNDGDLDILLTGDDGINPIARLYRNTNLIFAVSDVFLLGIKSSSAAWGDFDRDGDLDILLAGLSSYGALAGIYESNRTNPGGVGSNTPPTTPGNLNASINGGTVTLRWDKASDNQTAQNALTYNVYLGTSPNGVQKVSPMSRLSDGFRRLPSLGNSNHRTTSTINNLPAGTYYWSVQTVDNSFAGSAFAAERNFTITPNNAPVVSNPIPAQTLNLGSGSFTQNLNLVFNDPDGDPLTFTANSSASNIATASVSGNTLTVTPVAVGTATMTVTANDNRPNGTVSTTFTVTVKMNRAPTVANAIANQNLAVGGLPFTRNLNTAPAVFNDPDGDPLTYTASSSATNIATASISGSTLTVTAISGGSATITVTASDGSAAIATTFIVTVANRPPVVVTPISNQNLTVGGAPFTQNLAAIFNDPDGDALTYSAVSGVTNIATAIVSGNTLAVTAVSGGGATITVSATDGKSTAVSTMFTANVANRPPVLTNTISTQNLAVGGTPFTQNLNLIFSDPDGDALTFTASSSATNIATASLSGSTLTVTAISGGSAAIMVSATDGKSLAVSTPFTANVANRPPVVTNTISNQNLAVGGTPFTQNLNLIFSDPDGDALTFSANSSTTNIATATVAGNTLTVTAVAGGSATISVTATDGKSSSAAAMFMVIVANQPPVVTNSISNQSLQVGGAPFTQNLNLVFSDPDGDVLTFTASSSATNIVAANVPIGGNTLTVTALSGGSATVTVTATDRKSPAVPTTFLVTIGNQSPMVTGAIPSQNLAVGGTPFTQNLNLIFTDPDGDALSFTGSSSATTIATASVAGNVLMVTALSGGSATITVTATDGKSPAVATSFTVTVANRPPIVTGQIPNQNLVVGGTPFTQNVTAIFSDPDGDALTFTTGSSAPNIATANVVGSILTVTAVSGGNTVITVSATDGKSQAVSTSFTVAVANRPPVVASTIPNQILAVGGTPFVQNLNLVFNDPDGDALSFTVSTSATNTATASVAGSTLSVTAVAIGSATITVNGNDGKGGSATTTFGVTVNAANRPPNVAHTATTLAQSGQNILIVVSVTDDRGVNKVDLNYRDGGNLNFTSTPMTLTSGSNYQAVIPANVVTSRGVEYFIIATDMDNGLTRNPGAPNGIYSVQIQVTSEAKPIAQPAGSARTAYRLFSVPLQLDNASAAAVLEDDLGPYDITKWRLFGLAAGQSQDPANKEPYVEFPNAGANAFPPGLSLFLIVRDPGQIIDVGVAKSIRTDQSFRIALQPGHNLIATPFNFPVSIGKLSLKSGGNLNALKTYSSSGAIPETAALQPWEGYYFPNVNQTFDTLFVNPNLFTAMIAKTVAGGWKLRILANCAGARDDYNFAGVSPKSLDGYDDNDLAEPPPIGEYVSLYFPHPEWEKSLTRFSDDMRAASNPNQQWRFVVESSIPNEAVNLRFEGWRDIDPSLTVLLVDDALNYKQNLRENPAYQYQPRSRENTKTFTLIVGKDAFVEEQTANAQGVPENFVLEQNFPNPFSSGRNFGAPETAIRFGLPQQSIVTIKIFDLAGHEVVTLLDRAELPAGRHQRLWNGRDAQGRTVTSGIYFCQLVAGSFSKTIKLMVVR